MTLANKAGMPIEAVMRLLPARAHDTVARSVNKALEKCLDVALSLNKQGTATPASKRLHTLTTAVTGAAGGFFGLPGLAVELPVTTTIMLHSIAEIARANGENLSDPRAAIACLEVLALGPPGTHNQSARNHPAESAYYATRAALAQVARDAAAYVAQKGAIKEGAPALVSFMAKIAARFGLEVSEKAAAQLIPIAGAAGGLALNVLFTNHFQQLAEGHFTIRRLERKYTPELIHQTYQQLS